jgi:hypothetical protein
MADRKLSGRQIMELFYVEQESDAGAAEGDVPTVFRCKCGKTRSQRLKHGYSNLVQHVRMKHSDWVEAATLEAHPGAAPAIANQVKSSPPKRNGKAKAAWLGREQGEANGVEDETIAESSDEENATVATAVMPAPASAVKKRSDYLSWDDYFMSVAFLSAMRSKGW